MTTPTLLRDDREEAKKKSSVAELELSLGIIFYNGFYVKNMIRVCQLCITMVYVS